MSVSDKVKCIDGRNKTLSISRQCELLQLPRSSYYRPRDCQIEDEENLELMRLIDEEFLRHPFYGSRKMKGYLNRKGIPVNRKRIQRLMRLMDWASRYVLSWEVSVTIDDDFCVNAFEECLAQA